MIKFDKKQNIVSIIAPSSARRTKDSKMDVAASFSALDEAVKLFTEQGMKAMYDSQIFTKNDLDYLAAPKSIRLSQLKEALENPDVKIISAFRGGYGSSEIVIDAMDVKPSGPKILIGFSDVTVLHLLFNQHYQLPSIHGMVSTSFVEGSEQVFSLLNGGRDRHKLENMNALAGQNKVAVEGVVMGGNLSMLCSMIGTKLTPKTNGKILIIEDIGEAGYKVHRYLIHLHNSGLIQDLKAIIFAEFTKSDEFLDASINHFVDNYLQNIPVYRASKIGHTDAHPFILGSKGVIENGMIEIENPFKVI